MKTSVPVRSAGRLLSAFREVGLRSQRPTRLNKYLLLALSCLAVVAPARAQVPDVQIRGLPDYDWYAGCFGTASGNLMGYWDRHGLPGYYTGPTAGGVAPLNTSGTNASIRSLWASRAGVDGRPANRYGHIDDYYAQYEDSRDDPYVLQARAEHAPDCLGDFIGLSQKKFADMNGECDGNIDGYCFVYWDTNGNRRINYTNTIDLQSGLKAWTKHRGYDAEVFSQLIEFNPHVPAGRGFTWADLKAEIDAGFPLLVFLQDYASVSRPIGQMSRANPLIHGMLIYGYEEYEAFGLKYAYVRTSWASGPGEYRSWSATPWAPGNLSPRGVISFRPHPRVTSVSLSIGNVTVRWEGPVSEVEHSQSGVVVHPHRYQLQRSTALSPPAFSDIGPSTTNRFASVTACCEAAFFRVRLLPPQP